MACQARLGPHIWPTSSADGVLDCHLRPLGTMGDGLRYWPMFSAVAVMTLPSMSGHREKYATTTVRGVGSECLRIFQVSRARPCRGSSRADSPRSPRLPLDPNTFISSYFERLRPDSAGARRCTDMPTRCRKSAKPHLGRHRCGRSGARRQRCRSERGTTSQGSGGRR